MNNLRQGLTSLKHVTLNGIAKTSLLSQHNLMPEHDGKVIKKLGYEIDRSKGLLVFHGDGNINGEMGMLNYNGGSDGEQKYVFDCAVIRTPGDILAAYRKNEKGEYQPYSLQLDLIYHVDKDVRTFLIIKIPICVTTSRKAKRGDSGENDDDGELKYQQFFREMIGKIKSDKGDKGAVEVETKGMTLNHLFPLHGEMDKEELTFFTYEHPDMKKEGVRGGVDVEKLHVIVFKNYLELDCNEVANKLVKLILVFEMGRCNAEKDDDMCLQVHLSGKFSNLMKNVVKGGREPSRDLDIFAVSLRLSPEDYKRLTEIVEKKKGGNDEDGGDVGKDGGDGKKEEFVPNADSTTDKHIVVMGVGFYVALGIMLLFFLGITFYTFYYRAAGSFFGGLDLLGADIAGTFRRLFSIGIGPGFSVFGMQVLQPKRKRGILDKLKRRDVDDNIFNAESEMVDLVGAVVPDSREVLRQMGRKKLEKKRRAGAKILDAARELRTLRDNFANMLP